MAQSEKDADHAVQALWDRKEGELFQLYENFYGSDAPKLPPITNIATIIEDFTRDKNYHRMVKEVYERHGMADLAAGTQVAYIDEIDRVLESLNGDGIEAYKYLVGQRDLYIRSRDVQRLRLGQAFATNVEKIARDPQVSLANPNQFRNVSPEFLSDKIIQRTDFAQTMENYAQIVADERGLLHTPVQITQ